MRMTWLVSVRVFKFIIRDKRLVALMLVVPVVMALVIGYGFGGEIDHISIAVTNLDEPIEIEHPVIPNATLSISLSEQFIEYLDEDTDIVDVNNISTTDDWTQKKQMVLDGDYYGVILFPVGFTAELAGFIFNGTDANTSISLFVDNSNPQIGGSIIKAVTEGFQEIAGNNIGFSINAEFAYEESLTQLQYMVPSILPFAVFFMCFILSIISIINERKAGTMDLLLLSPYRKVNIILGYIIPLSVVAIIQSTILLLLTIFGFNVPIVGGAGAYFAVYGMLLLMGLCGMALGFLLSSVAKTELQAVQFIPMVIFTALLLSGILMPLETLPRWLQPISYIIPLTYGAEYMRTVMIEGTGFLWHWHLAPVIGFIVLMIFFASLTLKEK
ncbi:MAG: ABC transporter permease [Asgard group archaeon]|nr:ABC transporter permease [Asgard group archaeon]